MPVSEVSSLRMDHVVKTAHPMDKYPHAYSDFYGTGLVCVYKSGPSWPIRNGPESQGIVREVRPIYSHAIGSTWLSTGNLIYDFLDTKGILWTSIDPLAYANEGESKPFCPFIVSIGVKPDSLLYDDAVSAGNEVRRILAEAGFPDIEVAFVESTVTRFVAAGPRLLSFDPILNDVLELRKPFSPVLGLAIAPLNHPHFEGTGALYFKFGNKDKRRTGILTCAHVARPPPAYSNAVMKYTKTSQRPEEIIALGNKAYEESVNAMTSTRSDLVRGIEAWNDILESLGMPVEGENDKITKRRREHEDLIKEAKEKIEQVDALHEDVTKRCTMPDQRIIGFVLHSEKIELPVEHPSDPKFTKDWAMIELYDKKIDWDTFKGNKVYIGTYFSFSRFKLFSLHDDSSFLHRR